MADNRATVLKGGTVLLHDEDDRVKPRTVDVLIQGSVIVKIECNIESVDAEIIDCSDSIISPGFVDTHHHVYQTQFKGVHADQTLAEFAAHGTSGNFIAKYFSPSDVFWGQLSGCMEMVDGGTTTVVDYAHVNPSLEYNYAAISATEASGIRSIFCHFAMATVSNWETFSVDFEILRDHTATLEKLLAGEPYAQGRVNIGFAYDGWAWMPKQYLTWLKSQLDALSVRLITAHHWWRDCEGARPTTLEVLHEHGMLDKRWLIAHANNMPPSDAALIKANGAHVASTPSTELQLSMGFPIIAYRKDLGITDICSLGVDCQSFTCAYLPGEARMALQSARAARGEPWLQKGKVMRDVGYLVEESFNLATILGARAAKMEDKVGSIAVGKFADLVIFKKSSPGMVCASIQNPVAAIMLHSSPADVEAVMIGGIFRKRDGKLLPVRLEGHGQKVAGRDELSWAEVASAVVRSKLAFESRTRDVNMEQETKKAEFVYYGPNAQDILTSG
ncbi:unnamed protein product [Clonostachys rosea]|uniref:Amidohydrolase-related domain-containing protein n=1 Tax=Bionectria ochroleuca TaxID=29856 RepID=A0ABY6TWK3_BIOOC|nr:unnamed protein product [Clonostachys rosea]